MPGKNPEKIQSLNHFFEPHAYYMVKNKKKIWNYRVRIFLFYFTGSLFRHYIFYSVSSNN